MRCRVQERIQDAAHLNDIAHAGRHHQQRHSRGDSQKSVPGRLPARFADPGDQSGPDPANDE